MKFWRTLRSADLGDKSWHPQKRSHGNMFGVSGNVLGAELERFWVNRNIPTGNVFEGGRECSHGTFFEAPDMRCSQKNRSTSNSLSCLLNGSNRRHIMTKSTVSLASMGSRNICLCKKKTHKQLFKGIIPGLSWDCAGTVLYFPEIAKKFGFCGQRQHINTFHPHLISPQSRKVVYVCGFDKCPTSYRDPEAPNPETPKKNKNLFQGAGGPIFSGALSQFFEFYQGVWGHLQEDSFGFSRIFGAQGSGSL